MGSFIATWGVFVIGDDINDPVEAARVARKMADEHFRSIWGVEDVDTGDTFTIDVVDGVIVNPLDNDREVEEVA